MKKRKLVGGPFDGLYCSFDARVLSFPVLSNRYVLHPWTGQYVQEFLDARYVAEDEETAVYVSFNH